MSCDSEGWHYYFDHYFKWGECPACETVTIMTLVRYYGVEDSQGDIKGLEGDYWRCANCRALLEDNLREVHRDNNK